jgi:hypothetical protein
MIQKHTLIFLLLLLLTNCNTDVSKQKQEPKNEARNFRNIDWNMTFDDVIKNEDAKLAKKTDSYLAYDNINMFNTEFSLVYSFKDNKLMSSKYFAIVNPITGNPEKLYNDFKRTLSEKYGKPFLDEVHWSGMAEQLPVEKRRINDALLLNNVNLRAMWNDSSFKPNRIIALECQKVDKSIILDNVNIDVNYQTELQNAMEKKLKQNF